MWYAPLLVGALMIGVGGWYALHAEDRRADAAASHMAARWLRMSHAAWIRSISPCRR